MRRCLSLTLNPVGATAIWVRDQLDGLWCDEDFAGWYPRDGRPGISRAQLAAVCVLQPWSPATRGWPHGPTRCCASTWKTSTRRTSEGRSPPRAGRSSGFTSSPAPPNSCPSSSDTAPAARCSSPTARHRPEHRRPTCVRRPAGPRSPATAPRRSSRRTPGCWPTPLASADDVEDLDGWTLHHLRHSALTHAAEDGTSCPLRWPAQPPHLRQRLRMRPCLRHHRPDTALELRVVGPRQPDQNDHAGRYIT